MANRAPPWLQKIEEATSNLTKHTVAQLATLDSNVLKRPRVRTIVLRGAISNPDNLQLPLIIGSTDIRTPKVTQLERNPRAELAWWIEPTQHQYRIGADVYCLPHPEHELYPMFAASLANAKPGTALALFKSYEWEKKRELTFRAMTPSIKAGWCRTQVPGSKLEGGEEEARKWPETLFDPDDPDNKVPADQYDEVKRNWDYALKNFALLVVDPVDVELVDFASRPNKRILYTKGARDGEIWQQEDLVP